MGRLEAPTNVLLLVDGPAPRGLDRRPELNTAPWVEGLPELGLRTLLLGPPTRSNVRQGLKPPVHGFVEVTPGLAPVFLDECIAAAARGGLALSLSTRTAGADDPVPLLAPILAERFALDEDCAGSVELCLAEALGNAMIHGNLGIASELRASHEGFQRFRELYLTRLACPDLAERRILVTIVRAEGSVRIQVADQGDGFDLERELAKPLDTGAKSGRGLSLIRRLADNVEPCGEGRGLAMTFPAGNPAAP